jgi:aldehyde dehydrogenase
MIYAKPNTEGSKVRYQSRYGNFIGGAWVPPAEGKYFENTSPVDGKPFAEFARSTERDVERALDAAHGARERWGKTSPAERSRMLLKIADAMEANAEMLEIGRAHV